MTMTLFKQLEAEWSELAVSPPAVAAVETWARSDLPLLGLKNLRDVVQMVQRSRLPSRGDQVLACLATRAPSDPLATRQVRDALGAHWTRLDMEEMERTAKELLQRQGGVAPPIVPRPALLSRHLID